MVLGLPDWINTFYLLIFQKKLDTVLKNYDTICQVNSERCLQLERAQSLVSQFWETYEELWPWLTDTQRAITQLPAPALEYETLRQQQEEHRVSPGPGRARGSRGRNRSCQGAPDADAFRGGERPAVLGPLCSVCSPLSSTQLSRSAVGRLTRADPLCASS